MTKYDICILGGGILGVTLASKLHKNTNLKVCVIEARSEVGQVQTNKNSGVVHSGIFYKESQNILPFCLAGKQRIIDFCLKNDLPIKLTGKSIKFNSENKNDLINRCENYGIPYDISGEFIKLPEVCLVDYFSITKFQYENCKDFVKFYFGNAAKIENNNTIKINSEKIQFEVLFNLSGICANDIYREYSRDNSFTVCEILGRYHEFDLDHHHMIYNGPDKSLPFLGVHITPTLSKSVKLGPDAFPIVFSKTIDNKFIDIKRRSNFYFKNYKYFNKNLFNHSAKSMISQSKELLDLNLTLENHLKSTFGIRSVLLKENGELEKNFIFKKHENTIHFLNSHSPAATCAFTIADYLINMLEQ